MKSIRFCHSTCLYTPTTQSLLPRLIIPRISIIRTSKVFCRGLYGTGMTATAQNNPPLPTRPPNPVSLLPPTLLQLVFRPPAASSTSSPTSLQQPLKRTFQLSLHAPPRALLRELKPVFPSISSEQLAGLAVLCVYQPTQHDLVTADPDVNRERDICLELVRLLFARLAEVLKPAGCFFDYTDPPSGMPVYSRPGPALFPDVDSHHRLLKYPITHIGTCALVSHPVWTTRCYPSTGFVGAEGVEMLKEWAAKVAATDEGEELEMNEVLVALLEEDARMAASRT